MDAISHAAWYVKSESLKKKKKQQQAEKSNEGILVHVKKQRSHFIYLRAFKSSDK